MKLFPLGFGLTVAFVISSGQAFAQFGSVRGKVADREGNPIAEATVVLKPTQGQGVSYKSKTKKDGTFIQLTSQTSGPWIITIAKDGYAPWEVAAPVRLPLGGDPVTLPTVTLTRSDAGSSAAVAPDKSRLSSRFKSATDLLMAADAAEKAGDPAAARAKLNEAEAAFEALLESGPPDAGAHFNLGLIYEKKEEWDKAAAAYQKAAELKPDMIDASIGAGAAYLNAHQTDKAAEVLNRALKDGPADARVQGLLGLVRYNEGKYAEAAALYEKVKEAAPANPDPYYYLAMIAVAENRADDAVQLLQKYVSLHPEDPRALKVAEDLIVALKKK